MCGLVGVAAMQSNGLSYLHQKLFNDLIIVDSVRGEDGTGIFNVNGEGKYDWMKQKGNPYNLIQDKKYDDVTSISKAPFIRVLAGHNRWATRGESTAENAHPFEHNDTIMMHNGTLRSYLKQDKKDFKVDSDAFCSLVSTMGLPKAIKNIDGAFAVVVYNQTEKTLKFARNKERPLFMVRDQASNFISWFSEPGMFYWLNHKHGILKDFKIEEVPDGKILTFSLDSIKPSIREFSGMGEDLVKKYRKGKGGYSNYGNWQGGYSGNTYDYDNDYEDSNDKRVLAWYERQSSYVTGKKETPPLTLPAPQKQTAKIITLNNSSLKIKTNMGGDIHYLLGETLQFYPTELVKLNSETWRINGRCQYENDHNKHIEIVYNTRDKVEADLLMTEMVLIGSIRYISNVPNTKGELVKTIVIMKDVDSIPMVSKSNN